MNINIKDFEKETGLKIRIDEYTKQCMEISGKSFRQISNAIDKYNIKHNCNIHYYDDMNKDCTYIVF